MRIINYYIIDFVKSTHSTFAVPFCTQTIMKLDWGFYEVVFSCFETVTEQLGSFYNAAPQQLRKTEQLHESSVKAL